MPKKARPPEPEKDESKAWLDSYADAMTLLLAFFIMLFAFSLVDEQKFLEFKFGVNQALGKPNPTIEGGLGILEAGNGVSELVSSPPAVQESGGSSNNPLLGDTDGDGQISAEEAEQLEEALKEALTLINADAFVVIERDGRGVVLSFDERVLFRSGDSSINPDGQIVLRAVAQVLATFDNQVIVEGHTDNVPTTGTRWPTNWELSTSRATTVLRFFTEIAGLEEVRFAAAGYSDTRPRASNSTADGRSKNRRVEVVVLIEDIEAAPDLTTGLFPINVAESVATGQQN